MKAGLSPSEFWRMTPWQTKQYLKAYSLKLQDEHDNAMWSVWHIAALSRIKKLPPLKDLMRRKPASSQKPGKDGAGFLAHLKGYSKRFKESKAK